MRPAPAESAVVAFARLPRPGQVKTRLAAGVGDAEAAEFYRRCAEAAIAELGRWPLPPTPPLQLPPCWFLPLSLPWLRGPVPSNTPRRSLRLQGVAVYLFYAQPEDEAEMAAWLAPLAVVRGACLAGWLALHPFVAQCDNRPPGGPHGHLEGASASRVAVLVCLETSLPSLPGTAVTFLTLQSGLVLRPQLQHPDLGARMANALQHAFAAGHRRAVIVGTDIPDLTAGIVLRALRALDSHQVRVHCPRPAMRTWLPAGGCAASNISDGCRWCTERWCASGLDISVSSALQAVFGPAQDGGFYLLALSSLPHALFEVRGCLPEQERGVSTCQCCTPPTHLQLAYAFSPFRSVGD